MWREMARVVSEVRPQFVFVENSPMLVTRGLERVLGDLTSLGYDTRWTVMGAADVGAPHQRDRIWIRAALSNSNCRNGDGGSEPRKRGADWIELYGPQKCVAHAEDKRNVRGNGELGVAQEEHDNRRGQTDGRGQWWQVEPDVGRVVDGVAARVDRLKAIGNGQVPEVARRAWEVLNDT
jgi:DNA (cytosine-5)-methyltransferase 1